MKIYASYRFTDFVICFGYKGHVIKEYFANYLLQNSDFTVNTKTNNITFNSKETEDWYVTFVNTGELTITGGRVISIKVYVNNGPFCLNYGDGIDDIYIREWLFFQKCRDRKAPLSTMPFGRFGFIYIEENDQISSLKEKNKEDVSRINGGFFVHESSIQDCIVGDESIFEKEPLERLTAESDLGAYKHEVFCVRWIL